MVHFSHCVIPAKAGIQKAFKTKELFSIFLKLLTTLNHSFLSSQISCNSTFDWIPAFAGMTPQQFCNSLLTKRFCRHCLHY